MIDPTLATAYATSLALLAGTVLGATIAFALVASRINRLTELLLDQRLLSAATARPRSGKSPPPEGHERARPSRRRSRLMRAPLTLLTASPAPESPLERGPGDGPAGAATPPAGHSFRLPEAVAVLMILTGFALIAAGPVLTIPAAPGLRGTLSAEARP